MEVHEFIVWLDVGFFVASVDVELGKYGLSCLYSLFASLCFATLCFAMCCLRCVRFDLQVGDRDVKEVHMKR